MEKHRKKLYLGETTEESQTLLNEDYIQLGNLHPKKREDVSPSPRTPKDQTIECDIQPTDTLQSLALKYNIPLAELKRVNNIVQESGFYALKRIKIPVKPSSFLKDLIPSVHSEANQTENGWYFHHKESPTSISSNLSSAVSTGYSSPCSETEQQVFHEAKDTKKVRRLLKEMDRDLERIKEKQSAQQEREETQELVKQLGEGRQEVLYTNFNDSEGLSNGSLLCWCVLLVLLVLSLLVIFMALMSVDHHSSHFKEEDNSTKHGS